MADTPGFLIEGPDLLFGENSASVVSGVDSDGFLIGGEDVLFGVSDLSGGSKIDSSGFLLQDAEVYFGMTISSAYSGFDSPGFLIDVVTLPWQPGDTGFLIVPNENTIPFFPSDPTMTEIIYPVRPINEENKILFKVDSEEWRVTQKSGTLKVEQTDTVRFRVDTGYMATFLNDLHTNKANQFRLSTPGYTPFGSNSEDNYVRVKAHSRPQREDRGLTQLIDVEFLFVAVF